MEDKAWNLLLPVIPEKLLLRPHVQGQQIHSGHRFDRQTTSEQQKYIFTHCLHTKSLIASLKISGALQLLCLCIKGLNNFMAGNNSIFIFANKGNLCQAERRLLQALKTNKHACVALCAGPGS